MPLPISSLFFFVSFGKTESSSDAPVKHDQSTLSSFAVKLLLERLGPDLLPLWKRRQREGQHNITGRQDQPQIDRRSVPRILLEPLGALQPHQNQGRDHHDGTAVEDPAQRRLRDGQGRCFLALSQAGDVALGFAFCGKTLFVGLGQDGVDVDACAHFFAAHQKDVERAGRGDGCKGHEAREDQARLGREAGEAGHEAV